MENTKVQNEIIDIVKQYQDTIDSSTWAGGDDYHACKMFLEWAERHSGEHSPVTAREFYYPVEGHDQLDATLWEMRGHFLRGELPNGFRI